MENNKYRNTNDINDAEYRQMRKSEDSSYEYHGADAEDIDEANADNGYPEVVEHNESGSVYDLKTDFIVLLPDEIIRIPQDSNLACTAGTVCRYASKTSSFVSAIPRPSTGSFIKNSPP